MDGGGKLKNWIMVAQPWAAPASISPAFIGFSYVFYLYKMGEVTEVNWFFGVLALIGVVIFHLSGNLLGEYHDFVNGVDVEEDRYR